MSFDRETRNRLARAVGQTRELLKADAMDQLRRLGFQEDGTVLGLDRIEGLAEAERTAGKELRALLAHLVAGERGEERTRRRTAYDRLAREIGFTTLNRLVALRMAEERGLLVQAVGKGFASSGFQVYELIAGGALGGRDETYRAFLECLFDEIALDLPLLFDRADSRTWIFPGERCLEEVLGLLNDSAIAPLWAEDEAIGWVYQYYNDPDERKKMRESQAPRNSRELAVRNQFFTPRYIVEFLTDNTLGRTWYEMRRGETRLIEECRYLVRHKHPVWLEPGEALPQPFPKDAQWTPDVEPSIEDRAMWTRPNPEIEAYETLMCYALTIEGYSYARQRLGVEAGDLANERLRRFGETGQWEGTFEELRVCLFFEQRRYRHFGEDPEGEDLDGLFKLNRAICDRWDLEAEAIPHRPKKDPRELRILDPACGSGHFLLYAFDLLLTIYDEAYDDSDLGPALRSAFPDRTAYERQVPALIVHNNLHGIDIDSRACQIAALALWLRAQRRWQELGLKPAERPGIRRTNIVCAEPMPGERDLLEEYLTTVDPRLRPLVRTVWEKMQFAGEAGSLLKIEVEIGEALKAARVDAMVDAQPMQIRLDGSVPLRQTAMSLTSIDEIRFWDQAEAKLLDALRDYAAQASDGNATQRRLFAGDTTQGFAFVDVCRTRFDVVLMNPPFGAATSGANGYIESRYPRSKSDLLTSFVERGLEHLVPFGFIGAITARSAFFNTESRRWREDVALGIARPTSFADIGYGVLDGAKVEVAAYCLQRIDQSSGHLQEPSVKSSVFFRLQADKNPESGLYRDIEAIAQAETVRASLVDPQSFRKLPGAAFVYWVNDAVLLKFSELKPLADDSRQLRQGLATADDFRFVRAWWEVPPSSILVPDVGSGIDGEADFGEWAKARTHQGSRWVLFAKGSGYLPFFANLHLVVNWHDNGKELREFRDSAGRSRPRVQNEDFYFREGISWPRTPWKRGSFSFIPAGSIFSDKGPMIFPKQNELLSTLVILNSDAYIGMLHLLMSRGSGDTQQTLRYEVGLVSSVPFPQLPADLDQLTTLAQDGLAAAIRYAETDETSRAFTNPGLLLAERPSLRERLMSAMERESELETLLVGLQNRSSEVAYSVYGFSDDGRSQLQQSLVESDAAIPKIDHMESADDLPPVIRNTDPEVRSRSLASDLISFAVGVVFDRWQRTNVEEGEVLAADGLCAGDDELLPGLTTRLRRVLSYVLDGFSDMEEEVICNSLRVNALDAYIGRPDSFFESHRQRYSKSRRQAPIYWPLTTPSGSYTLWVYYHRLAPDTLYTGVTKYVEPKLEAVRRELVDLEGKLAGASGGAATRLREQVEKRRAFHEELEAFKAELLRVAALPYRPNLDDGVIINAGPLHKLFRLPKWAKATRETWEKLERGDYDWAHLAYQIWPDRVREKCRIDRSLAIAHDLEHLYEAPTADIRAVKGRKRQQASAQEQDVL